MEPPPFSRRRVYAALSVQTLISAGTFLVAKRAMEEIPPFPLVILRFALSALVFLFILRLVPGPMLPPRGYRARVLAMGLLAGPVNQGFFFYGLSHSRPAHAALLYALTPIGVYLLQVLRGQERSRPEAIFGIGVALAGALVLLLSHGLAEVRGPLFGDLFILGAVIAWVAYTAEGKPLIADLGAVRATAWTMIAGALLLAPAAPFVLRTGHLVDASPTALWCIAYLGLLTSVVSYLLWYYALSKTLASKVAVFSNLQPAATALAAWAILGDPLTWEVAVGGALVIAGVWVAQGRPRA